jgi:hypothetical protein
MSLGATSQTRTVKRLPRWSSTGHARARQDTCPVLHSTPRTSPKPIIGRAQSKPIGQTTSHNHAIPKFRSVAPTDIAPIKSP